MNAPKYYKMNVMRACVTDEYAHIYIVGSSYKNADIAKNKQQVEVIETCPQITKEEFEQHIETNTMENCFFKLMYLKDIKS
jgi:hypothetical protein